MSGEGRIRVHSLEVGPLAVNAYIVEHVAERKAVLIDPGDEGERIARAVERLGLVVEKILLTHGHFDHVGAVALLRKRTGAPVCIHPDDSERMQSAGVQGLLFGLRVASPPPPDVLVREGDEVAVGEAVFRVAHTPGHTPGCVCYVGDGMAFVGDLIFAGSIGRTDLPGGDFGALIRSVEEKIFTLPGGTVLYPGHGPATTVEEEKRSNPFFTGGISWRAD